MIVFGIVLVLAALAALFGIAATGTTVHVEWFGMSTGDHSVGAIFAAGAIAGILLALGVMLCRDGAARRRRSRRDVVARHRSTVEETDDLRARNSELERSLAAERSRRSVEAPTDREHVDAGSTRS